MVITIVLSALHHHTSLRGILYSVSERPIRTVCGNLINQIMSLWNPTSRLQLEALFQRALKELCEARAKDPWSILIRDWVFGSARIVEDN